MCIEETQALVVEVALGVFWVLLGVSFGYAISRSMQHREWRKQDLQRKRDDVDVLQSCATAVEEELLYNQTLLEKKRAEYGADKWDPAQFELSTISFENSWPLFVQKGLFAEQGESSRHINRLYCSYLRANHKLEFLRNVIITARCVNDATKTALRNLIKETLEHDLEGKAVSAIREIKAELGSRKTKIEKELKRLEGPCKRRLRDPS